jgi:hypothetical protein
MNLKKLLNGRKYPIIAAFVLPIFVWCLYNFTNLNKSSEPFLVWLPPLLLPLYIGFSTKQEGKKGIAHAAAYGLLVNVSYSLLFLGLIVWLNLNCRDVNCVGCEPLFLNCSGLMAVYAVMVGLLWFLGVLFSLIGYLVGFAVEYAAKSFSKGKK